MKIPFTVEQFFAVFHVYNEAVWPAQLLLLALALIAIFLVFTKHPMAGPAVSAILAFLWAWIAVAYHLAFFARINPLAYGFAGLSLIGGQAAFLLGVPQDLGLVAAGVIGVWMMARRKTSQSRPATA